MTQNNEELPSPCATGEMGTLCAQKPQWDGQHTISFIPFSIPIFPISLPQPEGAPQTRPPLSPPSPRPAMGQGKPILKQSRVIPDGTHGIISILPAVLSTQPLGKAGLQRLRQERSLKSQHGPKFLRVLRWDPLCKHLWICRNAFHLPGRAWDTQGKALALGEHQ